MKTVLVQAGHLYPRQPGTEHQTGAAGEQEFVHDMRDRVIALLKQDGRFKTLSMPGAIPPGTKCDAAVFFHVDGAGSKRARGYSFGYPSYSVNKKLAELIAGEFNKIPGHPPHHADNYTRDEADYYGFGVVDTPGPEVLVEHGFSSNPEDKIFLLNNKPAIAKAHYNAILTFFGLKAVSKTQPIEVHIVDKDGTEHYMGTGPVGMLKRAVEFARQKKYKHIDFDRN